jgi:hypothetical protein
MIMSVFENITGKSRFSLKAWNEHINGAATILKLRGRSQLNTKVGFTLFMHVTGMLLISCMAQEIEMVSNFQCPESPNGAVSRVLSRSESLTHETLPLPLSLPNKESAAKFTISTYFSEP